MSLDRAVADLADDYNYGRQRLAEFIGPKLTDADQGRLPDADHRELARLLGAAGITAATTVAVLAADGCPVHTAAELLPMLGVPMASAIRALDARWHVPLIEASRLVGATGAEMREAGCSAADILALRPESILDHLPSDPHLWELAAGTMATNGTDPAIVVSHLVAHAPTAETFAAGLATAVDDPAAGLGLAARFRSQPEHLAAASERYGLSPAETATILRDEQLPTSQALATIGFRCGFDDNAVFEAWAGAALRPDADARPGRCSSDQRPDHRRYSDRHRRGTARPPATGHPTSRPTRHPVPHPGGCQAMNPTDDLIPATDVAGDGLALFESLVVAVRFLRRGARPTLTVWDAIDEALRWHSNREIDWDARDPLAISLGHLLSTEPDVSDGLTTAIDRWLDAHQPPTTTVRRGRTRRDGRDSETTEDHHRADRPEWGGIRRDRERSTPAGLS